MRLTCHHSLQPPLWRRLQLQTDFPQSLLLQPHKQIISLNRCLLLVPGKLQFRFLRQGLLHFHHHHSLRLQSPRFFGYLRSEARAIARLACGMGSSPSTLPQLAVAREGSRPVVGIVRSMAHFVA